jgi:AcrR family transcriptional regulator
MMVDMAAPPTPPTPLPSAPRRARDRARAELISEITSTARTHLAEHGAAALSLRAVSRDLGMASSAVYRYFPSRDALLTTLIIEAYTSMSDACALAHDEVDPADLLGRWRSIAHAARQWAKANPHEYALIYGSPVPGYAAPADTIDPATRVAGLLMALTNDIEASGAPAPDATGTLTDGLSDQLDALQAGAGIAIASTRLLNGIAAWVLLFGMINFELFGQFHSIFDDADDLFARQVDMAAKGLGLDLGETPAGGRP